jgi:hypothetical protein
MGIILIINFMQLFSPPLRLPKDFRRHILRLAVIETPLFIKLDAARRKSAEHAVLIISADFADLKKESHNGLFRHSCHADSGPD